MTSKDDLLISELDHFVEVWTVQSLEMLSVGNMEKYRSLKSQISVLLDTRHKLMVYSEEEIKEAARALAAHVIQSLRDVEEGFTSPYTEKGEVANEQMNTSFSDMLSIHFSKFQSPNSNVYQAPMTVNEQYTYEHRCGIRKTFDCTSHNYERMDISFRLNISNITV